MPPSKITAGQKFLTSILNAQYIGQTNLTPKRVQLAVKILEIDRFGKTKSLYEKNFSDRTRAFHLASMSKQFFALGLLMLIEDPSVNIALDDRVNLHITGWPKYANNVRIRHLLNHSSGLKEYTRNASTYLKNTNDPHSVLKYVKNQKVLLQNPGTFTMYCNTNYVVIACLIELVSRQRLDQFMNERIFKPLGMRSTFVRPRKSARPKTLTNYYRNAVNKYIAAVPTKNDFMPGDGGVYTTLKDLEKWGLFLSGHSVLGNGLADTMRTALPLEGIVNSSYGYGLWVGDQRVSHSGSWNGAVSYCRSVENNDGSFAWFVALGNCGVFDTREMTLKMNWAYDNMRRIDS